MCMLQGRAGTRGKGEAEVWGLVKAGDKKVIQWCYRYIWSSGS